MDTEWENGVFGYLQLTCRDGEERLVDIGSHVLPKETLSYLHELDSIIWACQWTKAYKGSILLVTRTDSHSLINKTKSSNLYDKDLRIIRRWGRLLLNEPGFRIHFVPASEDKGTDLVSGPIEKAINPRKI